MDTTCPHCDKVIEIDPLFCDAIQWMILEGSTVKVECPNCLSIVDISNVEL